MLERMGNRMRINKRKTKTFYRYAAVYFVVLFLLSGLLIYSVLSFSAKRIITLETRNTQNTLQRAADILEKQYHTKLKLKA